MKRSAKLTAWLLGAAALSVTAWTGKSLLELALTEKPADAHESPFCSDHDDVQLEWYLPYKHKHHLRAKDTPIRLALQFYHHSKFAHLIEEANPTVDWGNFAPGTVVMIPLPEDPRKKLDR